MRFSKLISAAIVVSVMLLFFHYYQKAPLPNASVPSSSTATGKGFPISTSQPQSSLTISKGPTPSIPFRLPAGFVIHTFATNLGTARDLVFSPGGTLLVSNPGRNQVIALPDTNHDGVADTEKIVVSSGNHVHGLTFYQNKLFVAETTLVVRYSWDESSLTAAFEKELLKLPANKDHNLHTLAADADGNLYVSVGSTCNVCNETSPLSATVVITNANGDNPRIFASGLRNAPFLAFNPLSRDLWVTEMGRDNLGDDVPPDEINIIQANPPTSLGERNYGWPICYGNKIHDSNFDHNQYFRDSCVDTVAPIFEIPAHSAPLGLTFISSNQFPTDWQNDLLVAYHGSWNRSIPTGYKVVHMKVSGNSIVSAEDFLTGFLPPNVRKGPESAYGRPVDLNFDGFGNLYISDDKAGNVYIVQKNL